MRLDCMIGLHDIVTYAVSERLELSLLNTLAAG